MKKSRFALTTMAAFALTITFATAAQAAFFRTHVSVSGNDSNAAANNCARLTPCRNFSAAYGVTSPGGEIVALDAGGFGGVTITTAVTIMALPGQVAFLAVSTGSTGILVSAGASDVVVLRNLQIGGSNAASTTGVTHTSGKLLIENCSFSALSTGIAINNAKADVVGCDIVGNTIGISTNGTGYDSNCQSTPTNGQWPGDATTQVRVDRGNLSNNGTGFVMNNPGSRHTSGCFCTPTCPFPTPTPVTDPNQNLITVFLHNTDNSSAGVTMNITGNTTFMSGTGATCTATPAMCASANTYGGQANPK